MFDNNSELLPEFKQVYRLAPADYTENCINVVMSIIRNEKLKLLAEVRERVIGEDLPLPEEIMAQTGTRHPGRTYCQAYTSIDLPKSLCYSKDKYVKGANGTSVFGLQRQR